MGNTHRSKPLTKPLTNESYSEEEELDPTGIDKCLQFIFCCPKSSPSPHSSKTTV